MNGYSHLGEKGLRDRLRNVVEHDFAHITYTQAVQMLEELMDSGAILHKIVTKEEKVNKGLLLYALYS